MSVACASSLPMPSCDSAATRIPRQPRVTSSPHKLARSVNRIRCPSGQRKKPSVKTHEPKTPVFEAGRSLDPWGSDSAVEDLQQADKPDSQLNPNELARWVNQIHS